MSWWLDTFNTNEIRKTTSVKSNSPHNYDSKMADRNIKYCTKCKRCWEHKYHSTKSYVEIYQDFVSYGKERKDCEQCKVKETLWAK